METEAVACNTAFPDPSRISEVILPARAKTTRDLFGSIFGEYHEPPFNPRAEVPGWYLFSLEKGGVSGTIGYNLNTREIAAWKNGYKNPPLMRILEEEGDIFVLQFSHENRTSSACPMAVLLQALLLAGRLEERPAETAN